MDEVKTRLRAARIFLRAAAYIRTHGWRKEGMGTDGAPRCSMGALASAYRKQKWDEHLSRIMYKTLYQELDGLSLTQFNYQHNNGEKVAELFERVAAKLQNNGRDLRPTAN
jgi:hypothetical protein